MAKDHRARFKSGPRKGLLKHPKTPGRKCRSTKCKTKRKAKSRRLPPRYKTGPRKGQFKPRS